MCKAGSCFELILVSILGLTSSDLSSLADDAKRPSGSSATHLLESQLGSRIDIDVQDVPLWTFVHNLAKQKAIEVRFDEKGIAAQSIPLDRPISVKVRDASVESVLDRVLRNYGLRLRREDGIAVIECMKPQPVARPGVKPKGQDGEEVPIPLLRINFDLDNDGVFDVENWGEDVVAGEDLEAMRHRIARRNVYAWVGGGPEQLERTLEKSLVERIDANDVVCGLTEGQRERLRLAGRGDIQRFLRQVDSLCDQYADRYQPDDHQVDLSDEFFNEVRELAIVRQRGRFGADSLFDKMFGRALTSTQKRRLLAVSSLRDAGAVVKTRGDRQVGVREIHLSARPVTDANLPDLAELPELEALSLDATRITDEGLENIEPLQQLTWLDLSRTKVSDAGLKHIAKLIRLERLELSNTLVTDAGLDSLFPLRRLKSIDVSGTTVTEAGAAKLRRALPETNIIH